jgi:hypothetical protein
MPSFTQVTVTGTRLNGDGSPATGEISFQLTEPMSDGVETIAPTQVNVELVDGAFSVELYANDDSTTTPTGVGYAVVESIDNAPVEAYQIVLSHAAAPTVVLDTIAHSEDT